MQKNIKKATAGDMIKKIREISSKFLDKKISADRRIKILMELHYQLLNSDLSDNEFNKVYQYLKLLKGLYRYGIEMTWTEEY